MNNQNNIIVDDEVIDTIDRSKRNKVGIVLASILIITGVLVGGLLFEKSAEKYNSYDELVAQHPNGAEDEATFLVQGKTYKYNTNSQEFVEMKELDEKDKQQLNLMNVQLDLSGLKELKEQIAASGNYAERQALENEYADCLIDLMGIATSNRDLLEKYATEYLVMDKDSRTISNKLNECQGVINELNVYNTELVDFINEDKVLFSDVLSELTNGNNEQIGVLSDEMLQKLNELMSMVDDAETYRKMVEAMQNDINRITSEMNRINEQIKGCINTSELTELIKQQQELQGALFQTARGTCYSSTSLSNGLKMVDYGLMI